MTTIIKATDHGAAIQRIAFNFDDMAERANRYLDEVREQAKEILAKAAEDGQRIRKQAEEAGRRAGEQKVDEKLDQKVGQQMQTLLPALRQAIEDIQHARHAWLTRWEQQGVHVAAAIAARVIRRELAATPVISLDLLREALDLAGGGGRLRVRLSPPDHAALGAQASRLVEQCARLAPAEIIADESITPGGCRVETEFGAVDQTIEAQLKRIEEELI